VVALPVDWLVRGLAPAVFAATGLTDDAADLDELPELTPAMFNWPGLLDRASRILTCAAGTLVEAFLAEHRAHPRELNESEYDVLQFGIGPEAQEIADTARISVLPHLIGQHAYRAVVVGVQLLHFRHGPVSAELRSLRDIAVTSVLEVQQQLTELATTPSYPQCWIGSPVAPPGHCRYGCRNPGSARDGHLRKGNLMGSNGFWFGVVMASDDARRAKARRNAKKSKAIRRDGVAPGDLTRARSRDVMDALVVIGVLVVGVWLWTWVC